MHQLQLVKPLPACAYAIAIAREPLTWGSAFLAVLLAAATATFVVVPTLAVIIAAIVVAAKRPTVQRLMDRRREAEVRRDKRAIRRSKVVAVGGDMAGVTEMVDQVYRADPNRARSHDLEALLDRYAELTIALAGCRKLLAETDLRRLTTMKATLDENSPHAIVIRRRIAIYQDCDRRCRLFEDELGTIRELIALLSQEAQSGASQAPLECAAIDERLAYFEALDAMDEEVSPRRVTAQLPVAIAS